MLTPWHASQTQKVSFQVKETPALRDSRVSGRDSGFFISSLLKHFSIAHFSHMSVSTLLLSTVSGNSAYLNHFCIISQNDKSDYPDIVPIRITVIAPLVFLETQLMLTDTQQLVLMVLCLLGRAASCHQVQLMYQVVSAKLKYEASSWKGIRWQSWDQGVLGDHGKKVHLNPHPSEPWNPC